MGKIEACLDERSGKTEDAFVGAEDDLVQVRNHLEGLADDEHDGDGDQHDAELVFLSLLFETPSQSLKTIVMIFTLTHLSERDIQ